MIDLRDGRAWLTSRLYLFAMVLPQLMPLRCFVFVGGRRHRKIPSYFLGGASPGSVVRHLEGQFPWLRKVMVESQMWPVLVGEPPNRNVGWWPAASAVKFFVPVAVGNVDPQPIRSALSKRLAVREFEQRPSDIVLLRVDELRHGICAAPMVQLVGKIELRLIEQPLAQG
jgi:hypothetical protein